MSEGTTDSSAATRRLRFAQTYADEYNREGYEWRIAGETVLESSVYEYVRKNSPGDTSSEEIRLITELALKELEKLR